MIIASLTTIPSRIDLLKPILDSVLKQTISVDHIEINIPYKCLRTGEDYHIPEWMENMYKVQIFRTTDYGAITKIAPTLLRHRGEKIGIWSIDDDVIYPPNLLEILQKAFNPSRSTIICTVGTLITKREKKYYSKDQQVMMMEGSHGVLYPTSCIFDDFESYVEKTSLNPDSRKSDDVILSNYFALHEIPILQKTLLGNGKSTVSVNKTPQSNHKDALWLQDSGHSIRYIRVLEYLKSSGLLARSWDKALIKTFGFPFNLNH
jgi:hypothetical protein